MKLQNDVILPETLSDCVTLMGSRFLPDVPEVNELYAAWRATMTDDEYRETDRDLRGPDHDDLRTLALAFALTELAEALKVTSLVSA